MNSKVKEFYNIIKTNDAIGYIRELVSLSNVATYNSDISLTFGKQTVIKVNALNNVLSISDNILETIETYYYEGRYKCFELETNHIYYVGSIDNGPTEEVKSLLIDSIKRYCGSFRDIKITHVISMDALDLY